MYRVSFDFDPNCDPCQLGTCDGHIVEVPDAEEEEGENEGVGDF